MFLAILDDYNVFSDPENMVIQILNEDFQWMVTKICRKLDFSTMATPHLHKRQLKKMLKDARWASLGFVIYIIMLYV